MLILGIEQNSGLLERSNERFRTTSWSVVLSLASQSESEREAAIAALHARYWPAVYAFLRRQNYNRDAAAELTQAFFADVVVGRALFDRASPQRGRLRTLILRALRNFCIDHAEHARVRGTGRHIALDELESQEAVLLADPKLDGEQAFERHWSVSLMRESLRRCEAHYRQNGRAAYWELFEAHVVIPAATGNKPQPLAAEPAAKPFRNPAHAAAVLQIVQRRVAALFREVVAETLDDQSMLETEISDIKRWLAERQ